ncbi:primosomal protein N' [Thermosulfurimonas sp. F29]|uniref:replication restart helicase PriA n=1 Tax=Thermosulfurimonas sp. F29 TaxID=2867247 RepID=UPI001C83B158|nr:primosomal protein N' [Thermosulfurimonas sp. F29]MBX6423511.1 primosomal protein N' [Thermosulfurimonas sp. F29]
MPLYSVVVPLPLKNLLLYESSEELPRGIRVIVPVKKRRTVGLIFEKNEGPPPPETEIRKVEEVLDPEPLFPGELLEFLRWCWNYYRCPPGEVVRQAFPPGLFREIRPRVRLSLKGRRALESGEVPESLRYFLRPRSRRAIPRRGFSRAEVERWLAAGILEEVDDLSGLEPPLETWVEKNFVEPENDLERFLADRGRWPLRFLRERFGVEEVKVLLRRGRGRKVRLPRLRRGPVFESLEPPVPNEEQKRALDEIRGVLGRGFQPFLLHGVTGSGKTLVYLEAAARTLELGRSVLVLVPEIALTPYVETHFVARFGERVAVLHSGLSPRARSAEWFRVARGEARVVVGARSAVFAPLKDLGLIVVDEEHEGAYKQSEGLRYQARDLALLRGKLAGAVVILGSATPSVKSYFLARSGRYRLLTLTERPGGRNLPKIEVVPLKRPGEILTPPLLAAMRETLSRGHQVLLFLNRRGYAPVAFCRDCGEALGCPNCTLTLTYHRSRGGLLCHHCGHEAPAFPVCPRCGGTEFRLVGAGTERVEETLAKHFPGIGVARLDRDTITSEKKLYELLKGLRRGEIRILVGTQMVAQGHDLPGVALVGILWAEGGLHLPDFRAAERTFQLLVQVAGRAGRGSVPGRVILQTRLPEHYVIRAALAQDYEKFYRQEIVARKRLGFPPFARLVLLVFSAVRAERAEEAARRCAEHLRNGAEAEVLGPVPAPLYRLAGRYRWQVLLRSAKNSVLERALEVLYRQEKNLLPPGVRLTLDRDPEELL